jgi:hypothetical protein
VTGRARSVRIVFSDPEMAYMAIYRLRGAGYQIDVSGSVAGDVVVTVQVAPDGLDALEAIVADHDGRMETEEQTDAR